MKDLGLLEKAEDPRLEKGKSFLASYYSVL